MSDAYIVRRGGGTSLNYKVVGGTSAPSSPKENWIWVNTSTAITSHIFSATEPESPAEGMVWFKTGGTSIAPFNALKKNTVMVYVVGVSQYVGRTWVSKTAEIYQDSKWTAFVTYVFKNGNIGLGGGIVINSGSDSDLTISDVITLNAPQYSDKSWRTAVPIDVTAFKTMRIKGFTGWSATNGDITTRIGLATESQLATTNAYTAYTGLSSNAENTAETSIDISALEGEYYVVLWWHCYGATGQSTITTYYVEFDV